MNKLVLILLTSPFLLVACFGTPGLDDDDADRAVLATTSGVVQRIAASETSTEAVWTTTLAAAVRPLLAQDPDTIYVAHGARLAALDVEDGRTLWSATLDDEVDALVGPVDGALVVQTLTAIVGMRAADGQLLWSRDLLSDLSGTEPGALDAASGALVLGGDPTWLVDPASGGTLGQRSVGAVVTGVAIDGAVAAVGAGSQLLGLTTSALAPAWSVSAGGEVDRVAGDDGVFAFAVLGGGVGVVDGTGAVRGVSADQEVWQHLIVQGGQILAVRGDGTLLAFDSLAQTAWAAPPGGGDPTVRGLASDGRTIYRAIRGVVEGVNAADGSELWTWQPDGAAAAVLAL